MLPVYLNSTRQNLLFTVELPIKEGQKITRTFISEFIMFMAENKMWWLTPILVVFGLLGVLLVLGATGVAPFIYTLF